MTIEERAFKYGMGKSCPTISTNGYIQGATDQKKMMIDKFTQWIWENAEITREEKNRDMLSKLLDSLKED